MRVETVRVERTDGMDCSPADMERALARQGAVGSVVIVAFRRDLASLMRCLELACAALTLGVSWSMRARCMSQGFGCRGNLSF